MLLIDPGRTVASLRSDAAPSPYFPRIFRGDPLEAGFFLTRAANLETLVPLLLTELRLLGTIQRLSPSLPVLVLQEAARAVARGLIQVGVSLPNEAILIFRHDDAVARRDDGSVRFPGLVVASAFMARCLGNPVSRTAVDATLKHPRGARHQLPNGADSLAAWLASLLLRRELGLFPANGDKGGLRLAWIDHQGTSTITVPPEPPPPPPSVVAQIIQAVENALADLPADISAQAQTLIDAAEAGVAFCEECARAAADSTDA
ncbi:MAG: hypothetical protein EXR07_00445 [Acetobacteraceae bacterium]|nr:hypothetical protein [Acetobacteraceae bacterium]